MFVLFDNGTPRTLVLVTTDRNIRYRQNLAGRNIAIIVLGKGRWSTPGSYAEVEIPWG